MERNELVLVDVFDNEICEITKQEAHKTPKLHRAFSVFLIDGDKMLIQKRADTKYHTPSLWTNACCSHPKMGEDVVKSAERRTEEELGIKVKLKEIFTFTYCEKFREDLYEYEFDHVMLGNFSGEVNIDKEEASEVKWISKDELAKSIKDNPEIYTPWFLICCPKILKMM